jgi:Protein of unknown function (DUF1501)
MHPIMTTRISTDRTGKCVRPTTTRRDFLKSASLATGTALAPRLLHANDAAPPPLPRHADSCILLWMGGAMGQTESFDPKRYTPFTPGMAPKDLLCTFPQIDTNVDGIKFCEGVENLAQVMDRGALIRSYVAREYDAFGENLQHIPYQYKWHTGYTTPNTVPAPFLGAWISKALGPLNPDLPAYIEIGRSEKTHNVFLSLAAFQTSGCLGGEHGSLLIPLADRAGEIVRSLLPVGRFDNRQAALRKLAAASPAAQTGASGESLTAAMESAYRLMRSPSVEAFELAREPKESLEQYNTGPFGRGCLLARRLVENKARFVEVHVDFENAKGWDTHTDGHNGQAAMKKLIDRPVAALIRDLEARGLLDRTLVILATEFGRCSLGRGGNSWTKLEKPNQYGVHGHFAGAASVLMWGGGIKKGVVVGKTSDDFPCETVERPVSISDLHATIYNRLGIAPDFHVEVERRPFHVTKDGLGKPISEILA